MGAGYKNDIFVGDVHNGGIYHFKLNNERNDLLLPQSLAGKFIQNPPNPGAEEIVFGDGLSGVTDLTVGPDGYLYVVSIGQGKYIEYCLNRILENPFIIFQLLGNSKYTVLYYFNVRSNTL